MGTSQSSQGRRQYHPATSSSSSLPEQEPQPHPHPLPLAPSSRNFSFPSPTTTTTTRTSSGRPSDWWVPNNWTDHVVQPPPPVRPANAPPPFVEHKHTKKIKNNVNVHKRSIRVFPDHNNLDSHLISFTFDALVDGCFAIYYFAEEQSNCTFMPLYPDIYMPRRIPFEKGLGQKFYQPSGTGIDLGFFELGHLSKPSPNEDIFPLIISAEADQLYQPLQGTPHCTQITQAVMEKNNEGHFQVRVIKQTLWVDGDRYELREIYGIANSDAEVFENNDSGKECIICMTERRETICLPCRHMCLCSTCAKELSLQSNMCPICRHKIEELLEIKIDNDDSPYQGTIPFQDEHSKGILDEDYR